MFICFLIWTNSSAFSQHDLDIFEEYWLVILYKIPNIDSLMWSHEYIEALKFCVFARAMTEMMFFFFFSVHHIKKYSVLICPIFGDTSFDH